MNVQARSQIYSSAVMNNQDAFAIVMVTSSPDGVTPVEMLRRLASEGSTTRLPASQVHDERINAIDYTCATGFDQATECLWRGVDGKVVIVMGGPSRDYPTTLTLTEAAHLAL